MYSTLYWLTRLDAIHAMFVMMAILPMLAYGAWKMFAFFEMDDDITPSPKVRNIALILCAIGILGAVFVPSKNDAILIVAGGKTYEYIQADTSLQKLPFKTTEYLKTVLEQEIKEAKSELSK